MRRVMLVLAVAATLVALSVSPAFAEPDPPNKADRGLRQGHCQALTTEGVGHIPLPSVLPICVIPPL